MQRRVVNSSCGGQQSKLRRSLYEAVGLLLTRPATGERQIAVVPATDLSLTIARPLLPRASAAGNEIALVEVDGKVLFIEAGGGPV